ncbi:MAG: hypothetical protein HY904_05770 [Deltaproteobacteria bacterium]|nr:hypothetical protein [Deltaproteobacteria bacterium]
MKARTLVALLSVVVATGCPPPPKSGCADDADCDPGFICGEDGECAAIGGGSSSGSTASGSSAASVSSSRAAASSSSHAQSASASSAADSSSAASASTASSMSTASSLPAASSSAAATSAGATSQFVSSSLAPPSSSAGVTPPANDACPGATVVDLSSGTAVLPAALAGAGQDSSLGCESGHAPLDGADVFFTFTLTEARLVDVSLVGPAGSAELGLVLADGACGSLELAACTTDLAHSGTTTLSPRLLAAGTWWIIVDARGAAADATLTVHSAVVPSGETCGTALPLDVTHKGGTVEGDLNGHSDDVALGCESGHQAPWGPDLYFEITLSERRVLSFSLVTTATASELGLIMLNGACGSQSLARCSTDLARDGLVSLEPVIYPAGTYRVVVDSRYAGAGAMPFTLTVDSTPVPDGATCAGAVALSVSASATTMTGDLALHTADASPGCESAQEALWGPEIFYTFTLDQAATVTATLDTTATASELGLVLSQGACPGPSLLTCATDWQRDGSTSVSRALSVGTYVLSVDSRFRGVSMPYTLSVQAVP